MLELADTESKTSQRLNQTKDALLDSPQVLNFISGAVVILCDAIKQDLQNRLWHCSQHPCIHSTNWGKHHLQSSRQRLAQSTPQRHWVNLSDQYSEKVIRFISERIHEWDSSVMIDKIENEVGGDLHMILGQWWVVGAFIGLALGIIRAAVEQLL